MDIAPELAWVRTIRRTANIPCQVVRLHDFRLVADRIENVSESGILVGPADPVLTGDELIVSFQLPGFRDYIDAEAVVARVVHGRRPGENRRSLGLCWTVIDDYSKQLLGAYLRRLLPAPPRYKVLLRHPPQWQRRAELYA